MALIDPPPHRPAFTPGIGHATDHGAGVDRGTRSPIGGKAKPTYAPTGGPMAGPAPGAPTSSPPSTIDGSPDQPPSKVGPAPIPRPAPGSISGGPDQPPSKVNPPRQGGGRGPGYIG